MIGELITLRGRWRLDRGAIVDGLRLDHCDALLVVHHMQRLALQREWPLPESYSR